MTELTGLFKNNPALFSGKYIEYGTPRKLYNELNEEFNFVLDPCTTPDNPLGTKHFYTKEDDGLIQPWNLGGSVYINPPYHSKNIVKWVEKASHISNTQRITVVMLLPARTDTRWFHQYIYNKPNVEVRFVRGRLKFETKEQAPNTAPFPSMLAIFKPSNHCDKD